MCKFCDLASDQAVVFEDDGRVAYAYLQEDGKIIGDVWLYNHGTPPPEPEWKDKARPPYRNPRGFVSSTRFKPVRACRDISAIWLPATNGGAEVEIWIRGASHARLIRGSKPGWCVLAGRDGPLAKTLGPSGEARCA